MSNWWTYFTYIYLWATGFDWMYICEIIILIWWTGKLDESTRLSLRWVLRTSSRRRDISRFVKGSTWLSPSTSLRLRWNSSWKSRNQDSSKLEFQVKIWFKIRKILTLNSRLKSGSKTGEPSGKSKIQDSTSTVVPSHLQVWNRIQSTFSKIIWIKRRPNC